MYAAVAQSRAVGNGELLRQGAVKAPGGTGEVQVRVLPAARGSNAPITIALVESRDTGPIGCRKQPLFVAISYRGSRCPTTHPRRG